MGSRSSMPRRICPSIAWGKSLNWPSEAVTPPSSDRRSWPYPQRKWMSFGMVPGVCWDPDTQLIIQPDNRLTERQWSTKVQLYFRSSFPRLDRA
jgi:hypothetical protein